MNKARKTAKQRILDFLAGVHWISGKTLEETAPSWGFKPSYVSREARRLAEENKINHEMREGYVWYAANNEPKPPKIIYKIVDMPDGTRKAVPSYE